jgi:hypothetical protein
MFPLFSLPRMRSRLSWSYQPGEQIYAPAGTHLSGSTPEPLTAVVVSAYLPTNVCRSDSPTRRLGVEQSHS